MMALSYLRGGNREDVHSECCRSDVHALREMTETVIGILMETLQGGQYCRTHVPSWDAVNAASGEV